MPFRLDTKRRLVIPADVAAEAGWGAEEELDVYFDGNVVVVGTPAQIQAAAVAELERAFGDEDPADLILAARQAELAADRRFGDVA